MRKTLFNGNAALPPDLWARRVREVEQAVADIVRCEVWLHVYTENYHQAYISQNQEAVWEWQAVIKSMTLKSQVGSLALKKSRLTLQMFHAY